MHKTRKNFLNKSITLENWKLKKSKLLRRFPNILDTELDYCENNYHDFIKKIFDKIGKYLGMNIEDFNKYLETL